MNYYFLAAGGITFSAVIGHFTMGASQYLRPVMKSDLEMIPRRVMQSLFHYMSVILLVTAVVLTSFAFGENLIFSASNDVALIIAILYGGFAVVQIIIAVAARSIMLFQWVFWALISILTLMAG